MRRPSGLMAQRRGTMAVTRRAQWVVLYAALLLACSSFGGCGGGNGGDGTGSKCSSDSGCGATCANPVTTEPPSSCGGSLDECVEIELVADGRGYYVYPIDASGHRSKPEQAASAGKLKELLAALKVKHPAIRRSKLRVSASYDELPVDELRQLIESLGLAVSLISDEKD